MESRALAAIVAWGALRVGHEFGDYWGQPDRVAQIKGATDEKPIERNGVVHGTRSGQLHCAAHVALYAAFQGGALWAANRYLGLGLSRRRAALALAISGITHYAVDRHAGHWRADKDQARGLVRLAHATGKAEWLQRDPTAGPLLDQSAHHTFLGVAAFLAASPDAN